jgi:hypothetical protein
MLKKLFIIALILFAGAAAVLYFGGSRALNAGVERGIETFGPRVTQTPVTLEKADLSVLSGSGSLRGLRVGNPEGYKSEDIFALGQIDLKVDTGSVFGDVIYIDHIIIREPAISYEKKLTTSNVRDLMRNIEAFTGPSEPAAEDAPEEAGAKKQVVIRRLLIEDGTIFVGALGVGQTVPLPRIEMANIGEEGNRMTMAEAVDLVLQQVLKAIGPAIANAADLGGAAVDALKTQGLERAGQAIDGAADSVNEASEKVSEGLRDLINR